MNYNANEVIEKDNFNDIEDFKEIRVESCKFTDVITLTQGDNTIDLTSWQTFKLRQLLEGILD